MQELLQGLIPGTLVHARGERWYVHRAHHYTQVSRVSLEGADASNRHQRSELLAPFDRIQRVAPPRAVYLRRHALVRSLAHRLAAQRPLHGLWSAAAASIDVLPWQLAPALAVLGGATRLLLADEVGLGKTIQAGLVLAELRARGLVERALIVTPAAVRGQWVDELTRRFSLPVTGLDLAALLELERLGPTGANPWARTPIVVSSIDLVKRIEVRDAVERMPLDLLIVDEAHHLTPGTERQAAVHRLARRVPWVILASATPHSGDAAAYRGLLAVGAVPGDPGVMQVFRRGHAVAQQALTRRTCVLRVAPSPAEVALQEGALAYARMLCGATHGSTPAVQLFASLLARRAASSPWAAHATLTRRLAALTSSTEPVLPVSPTLPWEEFEDEGEEGREPWLPATGVADRQTEIACVEGLIAAATLALVNPSKTACVARVLRRTREPLIVFSEFRDTVEAFAAELQALTSVVTLHGGLDAAERQRRLDTFLAGRARVLLTTDVAGEGLNLQHGARTVLTIEWPWSPLRLEQRVGRVHRLGQTRVVHAVHLTARGSFEDSVVARVMRRAARAASDLAASQATERQVAAAVLHLTGTGGAGGDPCEPSTPTTGAIPGDARLHREAERIAHTRRWTAHPGSAAPGPAWTTPARHSRPMRVAVVVEVAHVSAAGGVLTSCLTPVSVSLGDRPERHDWARLCRHLAEDPRVRIAALQSVIRPPHSSTWAGVRARLAALGRERQATRPRTMQASLFDHRAQRALDHADEIRDGWDRWQARTLACLDYDSATRTTRVVAVLPLSEVAV